MKNIKERNIKYQDIEMVSYNDILLIHTPRGTLRIIAKLKCHSF